jgi:nicotinamidase-related amidase
MTSSSSAVAVLVIDMVNDFVTGVFGNERSQAMVPRLAELLCRARDAGVNGLQAMQQLYGARLVTSGDLSLEDLASTARTV